MKVYVFLFVLLATTWLPATEAWLRMYGGKTGRVFKHCPFTCRLYCPDDIARACYIVCANQCTLRETARIEKRLTPFPYDFKTYDKNGDGFISVDEMATTLKADKESGMAAVKLADDNGDAKLSEKEFNAAPYHKPEPHENTKVGKPFEESDMKTGY